MYFKNSFYRKSVLAIGLSIVIFTIAVIILLLMLFNDFKKEGASSELVLYENYIKSYIEYIETNINQTEDMAYLKKFYDNKDYKGFFDYCKKKENNLEAVYLFDNNDNFILSAGSDDKKEYAIKFIQNNKFSENAYVSEFFTDKNINENCIMSGRYFYIDSSEVKIIFQYNGKIFDKFLVKNEDTDFFIALDSDGNPLTDYNKYKNEIISGIDFEKIYQIIKLKIFENDYMDNFEEDFLVNGKKLNSIIYYKTVSDPDMIVVALKENKGMTLKTIIFVLLASLVFIIVAIVFFSSRLSSMISKINKTKEEIKDVDLTLDKIEFSKSNMEIIDLYTDKISNLCERYRKFVLNMMGMTSIFNTNISFFEIIEKKGIIIFSSEMPELFAYENLVKTGAFYETPLEEFFKFKASEWKPFKDETGVFRVDIGKIKRWIKVFCYDENDTKGIVTDVTDYIIKKYKDILDPKFDHITGFLKKEWFLKKTSEYINNNKSSFGCFASLTLNYYKTVYDYYGEYVSDEYLRTAASYFSSFFDGFFIGVKGKGDFVAYIYSENSKEDIKRKFQEWEKEVSSKSFITPNGKKFKFKFYVGYACYPVDAENMDTLIKYSVFALYETKNIYKESIHSFAIENYNRNMFFETRIKALDRLINENKAVYHFQPIVNIKDCSVYGYEALLKTEDDIFYSPEDIINVAITEGKAYLLEKMNILNCMEILRKNRSAFDNKRLFLNSMATNDLTEEDLRHIRVNYDDVRHLIVYEISTMFAENINVIKKSEIFKKNKVKFAIDQFGGKNTDDYSLLSGNPEFVKIDKNLILDIHLKKEKQSHVIKIVKYAKENNIRVIAVGVETYDELQTVIKLGIEFVQGYYISLPRGAFVTEIRENLKKEINNIKENLIV